MESAELSPERLTRRAERERRARLSAEAIAELRTRELYERQRELGLLQSIAGAANASSQVEDALQEALDQVCAHTRWPVGHAYILSDTNADELLPTKLWHLDDDERFALFREITERMPLARGIGLPGRVLASGEPVWIIDVDRDDNFPRARQAAEIGVKAGFAFPVLAGADVAAVLEFFAAEALPPDPRLLAVMAQVGTQLGRVIERRRAEDRIRHMAYHDALTNLPNRWLFEDRAAIALAQARRHRTGLAVMSLDLDRFKLINDSLGHLVGDDLLRAVGGRLNGLIREGDSLARFGGDEFVLILPGVGHAADAAKIATSIITAFADPLPVQEMELRTMLSIGISLYPSDGDDFQTLIKHADTALYRAKERGRGRFELYSRAMTTEASARLKLEGDLRRAVHNQEFVVYYQPVVSAVDERIVAVEALLRWQHPQRGLLLPGEFIAAAEETGLIVPMGEWTLRHSAAQVKAWRDAGLPPVRLAVNISVIQFRRPDFLSMLNALLDETGFDPALLELEITESVAMRDADATVGVLKQIKDMGIRTSVDDFGTGYSSLQYLRDLPVHTLKIDGSFVRDLTERTGNQIITRNIIGLAHGLNLRVIAEGVETADQARALKLDDCDELQGYLWARPMPAREIEVLLARGAGIRQDDARAA
jgi:diguanylate cyclase (GGDEF)-like protein